MFNLFKLFQKKKQEKSSLEHPLLAPYREQLLATKKPSIEMNLSPAENLPLWQSKVGGKPYLPLEMPYPMSDNGMPLSLLAQINFEEIPHLEGYPTQGILQFFINAQDDLMGADFDNPQNQDGFRVIYHLKVMRDLTFLQQNFPEVNEEEFYMPFDFSQEFRIEFKEVAKMISADDFRFDKIIPDLLDNDELQGILEDIDEFYSFSHRIGGYPNFTQFDPREYDTIPKDYELLLQLDSDKYLMWGDSGVGNFFIHPEDLKKAGFSKVAYTWDCC